MNMQIDLEKGIANVGDVSRMKGQEKTEKIRLEQEKTDGSAEPSPKTGMIRPFDTYMHPPARQREKDVHSAAC